MSGDRRRVVVTGLGVLCPLGNAHSDAWESLLAGKSGIRPLTRFDADGFSVRFAGEVVGFDAEKFLPAKELRQMDLFIRYGIVAGMEAIADAGLGADEVDAERIGIAIGSGIGGIETIENVADIYKKHGPRRISPFFIPATIINMISGRLSIAYNFQGPNISLVSACTTGAHNIGEGFRTILYGDADVMVCGGAEAAITPLGLGSFASARALSTRNEAPELASRPFDKDRDGFVLGEGAGVLVLEEYERARARGARIYAEIGGYGTSADGYHITAPLEDGGGAARSMKNAIRDARMNADEVGYINSHGTSTPLGDVAETRAVKRVFGDHARNLWMVSTKSMTGHLLGAAGGIEAVFSALALYARRTPPTINLDAPDEACDLDYVAHVARDMEVTAALSNSFGFGGTNASLLFCRAP